MDKFILATGIIVKDTVTVNAHFQMVMFTKVNGNLTKFMEKVNIFLQMKKVIMVAGKLEKDMAMVNKFLKMVQFMKVNGNLTRWMETVK